MECGQNDILCLVNRVWQILNDRAFWDFIWRLGRDIAAIAGVALSFHKWYEKREGVVFGRIKGLLNEQNKLTQEACRRAIQIITRPGPADSAKIPVFAIAPLKRLFDRRHWKPILRFSPLFKSADRKLNRIHKRLDQRQTTASNYQRFINEQRFAAHMLQGAIACGRADQLTNENQARQLHEAALSQFDSALKIDRKTIELEALELQGLHLRKLGRVDPDNVNHAPQTFEKLLGVARNKLSNPDTVEIEEQRRLIFFLARTARYLSEIWHHEGPASVAGRDILENQEENMESIAVLSGRQLLERAQMYEVASCIRVSLNQAAQQGNGTATQTRIDRAVRDYEALIERFDPKNWPIHIRVWRWTKSLNRDSGDGDILNEAISGRIRINKIASGHGCQFCNPSYAKIDTTKVS